MEEEIDLKNVIRIFWNKRIEIVVVTFLFIIIGYYYTKCFVVPEYTSTSTVILAYDTDNNSDENGVTTVTQSEIAVNDKLVSTYSKLAQSNSVLKTVIKNLKLKDEYTEESLRNKMEVTAVTNAQLIKISATNKDAELASKIANEITKVFADKVTEVYKINNVKVLNEAEVSSMPSNVNHTKNVILFALTGLLLSCIYAVISNLIDNTIESRNDVESITKLNVLVEIPICDFSKRGKK